MIRANNIIRVCSGFPNGANGIPISLKVLPMVPLVIPFVPMAMPVVPLALPMVQLEPLVSHYQSFHCENPEQSLYKQISPTFVGEHAFPLTGGSRYNVTLVTI